MSELQDIEEKPIGRRGITLGGFALFIDAVLCVSAWEALEQQIMLVPPMFIFFMLDHSLFLAVLTLLICAVEYVINRTTARALLLGVAVIFVLLAAAHVASQPPVNDEFLGRSE